MAVAVLIVVLGCLSLGAAELSVVPKPVSVEHGKGVFTFDARTRILYEPRSEAARKEAAYLCSVLNPATGWAFQAQANRTRQAFRNALLLTTRKADVARGKEGYELTITAENIVIRAPAGAGLFYGVQTLRQLLPGAIMSRKPASGVAWSVPAVTIKDRPRFTWRGMHLDSARHFFPVADVKRYLDLLAFYKINVFHWHLTDDQGWRLEIKNHPRLTMVGSVRCESPARGNRNEGDGKPYGPYFYTQDDIRSIVAHATKQHISVVPEIEMPGHSIGILTAYPELGCTGGPYQVRTRWGIAKDICCAGNEKTFALLEEVLAQTLDLFPSKFIHIGGDEAPKDRWSECPKCQARIKQEGLKDEHELQSYFVRRIEKFLNARGRRLIGWDEILEGGLAPNASVMSWRGEQGGIVAAKAGHDVVMTPTSHCYFDYHQSRNHGTEPEAIGGFLPLEKVYSYEPVPKALTAQEAKHVLGAQANVWTEYIFDYPQVEYMAVPRMCALAEVVWAPKGARDYKRFVGRLRRHLGHLRAAGVNYRELD
jgi:hexosaminidase